MNNQNKKKPESNLNLETDPEKKAARTAISQLD